MAESEIVQGIFGISCSLWPPIQQVKQKDVRRWKGELGNIFIYLFNILYVLTPVM